MMEVIHVIFEVLKYVILLLPSVILCYLSFPKVLTNKKRAICCYCLIGIIIEYLWKIDSNQMLFVILFVIGVLYYCKMTMTKKLFFFGLMLQYDILIRASMNYVMKCCGKAPIGITYEIYSFFTFLMVTGCLFPVMYLFMKNHFLNLLYENRHRGSNRWIWVAPYVFAIIYFIFDMGMDDNHVWNHVYMCCMLAIYAGGYGLCHRLSKRSVQTDTLEEYIVQAKERGIQVFIEKIGDEEILIDNQDIATILSIGMENAMEECEHMEPEKQYIHIELMRQKQYLAFSMDCGFDGEENQKQRDRMKQIQTIVDRYSGMMQVSRHGDEFQLSVVINYE